VSTGDTYDRLPFLQHAARRDSACRWADPGGPIYEDELVYAHHAHFDDGPIYLGNLVVETKRHTLDYADLTRAEAQAIGLLIARLSCAL
jgi:diadenosine tetraphosphate (Ap4A) HIT family hydrolase